MVALGKPTDAVCGGGNGGHSPHPTNCAPLDAPSWATSLIFPGWDSSNAVRSRRAVGWVYGSAREEPGGIQTQVRLPRLPPGLCSNGALALAITQACTLYWPCRAKANIFFPGGSFSFWMTSPPQRSHWIGVRPLLPPGARMVAGCVLARTLGGLALGGEPGVDTGQWQQTPALPASASRKTLHEAC